MIIATSDHGKGVIGRSNGVFAPCPCQLRSCANIKQEKRFFSMGLKTSANLHLLSIGSVKFWNQMTQHLLSAQTKGQIEPATIEFDR